MYNTFSQTLTLPRQCRYEVGAAIHKSAICLSMLPSRLQRPRVVWDCIYSYRSLGEGQRPTQSIQSDEVTTYANRICITARVNEYIDTSSHHSLHNGVVGVAGGQLHAAAALASGAKVNGSWRGHHGGPHAFSYRFWVDAHFYRCARACWPRKIFCSLRYKMYISSRCLHNSSSTLLVRGGPFSSCLPILYLNIS